MGSKVILFGLLKPFFLDDMTAEMPSEGMTSNPSAEVDDSLTKRGKQAKFETGTEPPLTSADSQLDSASVQERITTEEPRITTTPQAAQPTTRAIQSAAEGSPTSAFVTTGKPDEKKGNLKISPTVARTVLKPSRNDSLKQSLLALDGSMVTAKVFFVVVVVVVVIVVVV